MKKITLLKSLFILFCIPSVLFSQEKNSQIITKCLTDTYNAELLETYPNMMGSQTFRDQLNTKIEELANTRQRRVVITIPLVVHVLHNGEPLGSGPNITDAQVISQITVLNEDFRMMMGTPGESTEGGVDVEIEFVLAQRTPDGCPTNGINRVNICQDGTPSRANVNFWKTQTIWNPVDYMNMWSSKYVDGLVDSLGFAQFPGAGGGASNTDGVSAGHTYFGSSDYDDGTFETTAPYDKGRTMTHEVGHFLGLFHTFQGGCGGGGDQVADTPEVDVENYGCPTGHVSCGTIDMIENYMDYTDDLCMNTFTAGQKARVQAVMASARNRASLATSNAATPPASVNNDSAVEIESLNVSCGTSINPTIILTNWGTNNLTSATITYDVDSGTSETYDWTGNLTNGESDSFTLPAITDTAGNHDFNVSTNSSGDARACNNSTTSCFTLTAESGACDSVGDDGDGFFTSTTGVVFNQINNIDNNPGHTNVSDSDVGYSDFTGLSTDANRESTYDLTVYINTDGPYFVKTLVWFDWNQNCSFDDAGEEYDLGESFDVDHGMSASSPLSVTIPDDAVIGNTVMRVITKWSGNDGGLFLPVSCDNAHDGETEDYTINVLASLSVEDFLLNNSISIYPNPTNNVLNIAVTDNSLPDSYSIYNMLGQLIQTKQITSNGDLSINSSTLSNGMYFIKISQGNNSISFPFIKK